MYLTIAIDGPVGAGKSSVSDEVARELGILHLDTGAMYRAFAWKALQEGISIDDEEALCRLTQRSMPKVSYEGGVQHTTIDETDVTGLIRTPEISMAASGVSKVAGVRSAMVAQQQALAKSQSVLLDGRDIGTRVLPDAMLKIFLTASPSARARRRYDEMIAKGEEAVFEDVLRDVLERDRQDETRAVDPLRPVEDAQIIDTSDLNMEQTVAEILRRVRLKQGQKPPRAEGFTWMYKLAWKAAQFLFSTLIPTTYHNVENVQRDAPYILIGNHQSMLDPLIIARRVYRYQVRFMGKKELMGNPIAKFMFEKLLMIPVDRHHSDISAVRESLKVLKAGHVLGIFPEGTRHTQGVMKEMESGVAMIALRSRAVLIPAYIHHKPRLFHHCHVYYGQPISTAELADKGINKDTCAELMSTISQVYQNMVEKAK